MTSASSGTRPKIAIVVATVYQIKFFMVPHLKRLAEDYDVTLFLRNDVPGVLETLDLPVQVKEFPIHREISLINDIKALILLTCYLWRGKFQAVHTITPKAGLIGTLASTLAFVPHRIHTFQGEIWANKTGFKRSIFRRIDWLIARLTTHITVVSRSERDFLRRETVLKQDQGLVLGAGSIGGVDTDKFAPNAVERGKRRAGLDFKDDETVILFLGRLSADKGLSVLVEAFDRLDPKRGNPKLLIVGPDENNETTRIKKRFSERVTMQGFTPFQEQAMIAADILVLPSFREGFGMVALEAAAMAIPAVGSDIYGITDAIEDKETGLLFKVRDSGDLAEKLQTLVDDPELRKTLGEAGRIRAVKLFSQREIISHFADFYANLKLDRKR